jgi:Tat protein translocase TatB subunit
MFNVGPMELLAILGFALIVLGPQRLPEAVRTVGRVVGELRRISSGFQDELRNALDDSEVERDLDRLRASGDEAAPEATPSADPTDAEDSQDDLVDDKDPSLDDDPEEPLVVGEDDVPPSDDERAAS